MVLEILYRAQEYGSQISDVIDVALYILRVNPTHWSTFARSSDFDRDFFELKLLEIVHDLLYVKFFSINSVSMERPAGTSDDQFVDQMIKESLTLANNNLTHWQKRRKQIVYRHLGIIVFLSSPLMVVKVLHPEQTIPGFVCPHQAGP